MDYRDVSSQTHKLASLWSLCSCVLAISGIKRILFVQRRVWRENRTERERKRDMWKHVHTHTSLTLKQTQAEGKLLGFI